MNNNRRNLTKSQRAIIALDLKAHYSKEARERMLRGKKVDPKSKMTQGQKGSARELAAKKLGVSSSYVRDAAFLKEQSPLIAESVREGSMTISQGLNEIKKHLQMRGRNGDVGYLYVEFDLPSNVYLTAKAREVSGQTNEVVAQVKFANTDTANTDVLVKVAKEVGRARIKTVRFIPTMHVSRQVDEHPGTEKAERKLERIYGVNNVMIIAPHGVYGDDDYAGVVAREMARILKCHAIINEEFSRSEMDLNDVTTLSDEVKKQLLAPMAELPKRYKAPFVVLIHGCTDKGDGKSDVLLGYGQGDPSRLTIDSSVFDDIVKAAQKNKIKMASAEKDSDFCGWARHNLNQFFGGQVRSIQLEIKKTGFRDSPERAASTGRKLAKIFGQFVGEEEVAADPEMVEYELSPAPDHSCAPSLEQKVSHQPQKAHEVSPTVKVKSRSAGKS